MLNARRKELRKILIQLTWENFKRVLKKDMNYCEFAFKFRLCKKWIVGRATNEQIRLLLINIEPAICESILENMSNKDLTSFFHYLRESGLSSDEEKIFQKVKCLFWKNKQLFKSANAWDLVCISDIFPEEKQIPFLHEILTIFGEETFFEFLDGILYTRRLGNINFNDANLLEAVLDYLYQDSQKRFFYFYENCSVSMRIALLKEAFSADDDTIVGKMLKEDARSLLEEREKEGINTIEERRILSCLQLFAQSEEN